MTRTLAMAIAASMACACTTHIAPYRPKQRTFDPGQYAKPTRDDSASLYARSGRGLFEDDKAGRRGDVLIVRIDENETATRKATTKLSRKSDRTAGATGSILSAAVPGFDAANALGSNSDNSFAGAGSVERKGRLVATLPVRVRDVLPNGDLFVEGSKVIMVGSEEHHLYVSGIVRPSDIAPDNSIPSSQLAEAEIEYTGRGDMTDTQRPGWLARVLNKLMPF